MSATVRISLSPNKKKFINPFNHRGWLDYFAKLRPRFQYIRFLGLPSLKEQPDVLLEQLYVPIYLGLNYSSVAEMEKKDFFSLEDALTKLRLLVILGDPGSGKSTIVNYLATLFASKRNHILSDSLGHLIPIPFVLRDFSIDKNISFENLLSQFQSQPFWPKQSLTENDLHHVLESGQALILLDGLDEIGDVKKRKALRKTVFEDGISKYPTCVWVFTSRVIGYDEVPFDDFSKIDNITSDIKNIPSVSTLHLLPFNDDQIKRFITNWYTLREADQAIREESIKSLLTAISAPSINNLANNPNLLTIIALIYRVYAKLPSGRALLYDKITEAYLESIDTFRGIRETTVNIKKHILWLSNLAYDMQCKRQDTDSESQETFVPIESILETMRKYLSKSDNPEKELEYIARRSGLLLPKKPGFYNFVHLSFQEYFSALYLYECLMSFDGRNDTLESLNKLKDSIIWHESLIFLFEKLASHENISNKLFEFIFGESQDFKLPAVQLVCSLLGDFQSGLNNENKKNAAAIIVSRLSTTDNMSLLKNIDELPEEIFNDYFWSTTKSFIQKSAKKNEEISPNLLLFLQCIAKIDIKILETFIYDTVLSKLKRNQLVYLSPLAINKGPVCEKLIKHLPFSHWFKKQPSLPWSQYLLSINFDEPLFQSNRQSIINWVCIVYQLLNSLNIKSYTTIGTYHKISIDEELDKNSDLDQAVAFVIAKDQTMNKHFLLIQQLDLIFNLIGSFEIHPEIKNIYTHLLNMVQQSTHTDVKNNPLSFFYQVIHTWVSGEDNKIPQLPKKTMPNSLLPMYDILHHLSYLLLGIGTSDNWSTILKHVKLISDQQWLKKNLPFVKQSEMKKTFESIGLSLNKEKALFKSEWFKKGHPFASGLNAKPSEFKKALNTLKEEIEKKYYI